MSILNVALSLIMTVSRLRLLALLLAGLDPGPDL